ncbi:MAG: OmpA family protein [Aliarcobacter sp.]|nr:OmpA family protein [Aliarcobacter sp.]
MLLSTVACATMMLAANSDYKYEITPMIGGAFTEGNLSLDRDYVNAGLALGFNLSDSMIDQVELGFLRSTEDVEYTGLPARDTGITRVFTNLVKEYDLNSAISLYALAGVGVEIFDDEFAGNEDGIFGNYGAGIKYKIADQFALKADVRHLIEADHGDNTLLYNLGFAIPFGAVAKAAPVVVAPVVVPVVPKPVAAPKDSDNDGVIDDLDQCPNTMAKAKVDTVGCMTLVNLNINFDTNSSVIKDGYNSRIAEFASMLNQNPKLSATIEAHTDSVGSNAYNQKLSERRAASTVEALKALKVDPAKIKAVGYGETKPVASNATVEGRAENRRVDAVLNR